MQAYATREAAKSQARATDRATQKQIEHETAVREAKEKRLKECIEAYASLDESALFRKSDKDLAHFQAEHPIESPQYALAINEWNRRLVTRQVKATRFSAIVGLAGVIIGSFLGWFLASVNPPNISEPEKNPTSQQPNKNHHRHHPDQVTPKPE